MIETLGGVLGSEWNNRSLLGDDLWPYRLLVVVTWLGLTLFVYKGLIE